MQATSQRIGILEGASGGGTGGPGPLEIVAAEMAGDVDDFTDAVEAGDFACCHRFGVEFVGINASGGDFGFFEAFGAGRMDRPGVELLFEIGER